MKTLFTLFFFLIINSLLVAQNIDSLENILINSKGIEKVDILNKLSAGHNNSSIHISFDYAGQALKLSKSISYKKGEADALFNIGKGYLNKNHYDSALFIIKSALKLFTENNDSLKISSASNYLGRIYANYSNYDKALEYFFYSLKIAEKNKYNMNIAYSLMYIANIYFYQYNYSLALQYYTYAYNAGKNINDKKFQGIILNNLGAVYNNLGKDKKAIQCYTEALKFYTEPDKNVEKCHTLTNIGIIYNNQGQKDSALYYHNKAIKIAEKNSDIYSLAYISFNIADLYLKPVNFIKADYHLSKAIKHAEAIEANDIIRLVYYNYAQLFSKVNNFKKAFYYQSLYQQLHDSIYNDESDKRIADMEVKYETEKKEQKIVLLNTEKKLQKIKLTKQRILILFLIIFTSIVFFLFVIIYFQKLAQKKANKELVKRNLELVKSENEFAEIKFSRADITNDNSKPKLINEKYKLSTINEDQKKELKHFILDSMTEQKLYKDKNLNLQNYSKRIKENKNRVSQVINQEFNKNFSNFINEYRVKEARRMLSNTKYQNLTIEAIAYEVGFSSKSTFNRVFKDITGITPSFYLQSAKTL
jgi:AraC-like DNA-binding protein